MTEHQTRDMFRIPPPALGRIVVINPHTGGIEGQTALMTRDVAETILAQIPSIKDDDNV